MLATNCKKETVVPDIFSRLRVTLNCGIDLLMKRNPHPNQRTGGRGTVEGLLFSVLFLVSVLMALVLFFGLGLAPSARAQDSAAAASAVRIELNKLETMGEACRAYLLLENKSAISFESLKLDLVLFDGEGIVAKRLAVEGAPLPSDKTSLKVFDITGLPCDGIGRILLNKLTACSDETGKRDDCLGMVATSARGTVPFIK